MDMLDEIAELYEEYVDRMKEGQNYNDHITGESIAVVFPEKGHEVLYMTKPVDEFTVHVLKEFARNEALPAAVHLQLHTLSDRNDALHDQVYSTRICSLTTSMMFPPAEIAFPLKIQLD